MQKWLSAIVFAVFAVGSSISAIAQDRPIVQKISLPGALEIPGLTAPKLKKFSKPAKPDARSAFVCFTPYGSCWVPGFSYPGAWCCCYSPAGCIPGAAG